MSMAKVYPLYMHPDIAWRQQMRELKGVFTAEHLAFFIQVLDTSTKVGVSSPRGLKVMQRAYALLTEAKDQFEREFDK